MIISPLQVEIFILILARIAGMFIEAPLFNTRSFFSFGKIVFALWLAIIFWFVIPIKPNFLPTTTLGFVISLVNEVIIGFLIGFICNTIFLAVQSAGEIMDLQMGLSVASAFDPVFGSTISVVGRLTFIMALTIFIIANGHHLLLTAFFKSFTLLPLGKAINLVSPNFVIQLIDLGKNLWLSSLMLSAPIILLVFLSDFSFGIVSRVAPQVNVFMLGFQVKPVLGIIGFVVCLPLFAKYVTRLIELMGAQVMLLLVNLR